MPSQHKTNEKMLEINYFTEMILSRPLSFGLVSWIATTIYLWWEDTTDRCAKELKEELKRAIALQNSDYKPLPNQKPTPPITKYMWEGVDNNSHPIKFFKKQLYDAETRNITLQEHLVVLERKINTLNLALDLKNKELSIYEKQVKEEDYIDIIFQIKNKRRLKYLSTAQVINGRDNPRILQLTFDEHNGIELLTNSFKDFISKNGFKKRDYYGKYEIIIPAFAYPDAEKIIEFALDERKEEAFAQLQSFVELLRKHK